MPQKTAANRKMRSISGATLIAVSSAVWLAYAGLFALQLEGALSNPLGLSTSLGLASLHTLQALAFDHAALFPVAQRILVLFSAFLVTLIGMAVLPRGGPGATLPGSQDALLSSKGDQ